MMVEIFELQTVWLTSFFNAASIDFPDIDPVLVRIPLPFVETSLPIRWYSLAYLAGAAGAYYCLSWLLSKRKSLWGRAGPVMSVAQLQDFLFYAFLGVVIGGRLGYVLFYQTSWLWENPLKLLQAWDGGMSFHGGFLGVCAAMFLFARKENIALLRLADATAIVIPIGLFFGRIANFINAELYGRATQLPWGVHFPIIQPDGSRLTDDNDQLILQELARHPSQLYEAFLEGFVIFLLCQILVHKFSALKHKGLVTAVFLIGYGLSRSLVETVRMPDAHLSDLPLGLTMGMILSFPMILLGLWLVRNVMQSNLQEKQKSKNVKARH